MALGNLTKQLAEQAIRSATTPKPPAPPAPQILGADLIAQVQAMQKALKEDEELQVLVHAGGETIRVHEFYFPTWKLAILTGAGAARIIAPVDSLQLLCKVIRAQSSPPARLKIITPKPKTD